MEPIETTVRQSYIDLRGINLGAAFIRDCDLQPGKKYVMQIEGIPDIDIEGTLDKSGFIGGLSLLYKEFDLKVGDKLNVIYDGDIIQICPNADRKIVHAREEIHVSTEKSDDNRPVFEKQGLKHIHIEPYAPGNLSRWIPQTEADVYMVFGALSEYTDFRYCCGASQILLNKLEYKSRTKPDAILIDRATGQYLVAEFKMNSKEFTLNHDRNDVDVLICWEDDDTDRAKLPGSVLGLQKLLARAVKDGDMDL